MEADWAHSLSIRSPSSHPPNRLAALLRLCEAVSCEESSTWNSHWAPTGMTMRPPGFSFSTSTSGSEDAAACKGGAATRLENRVEGLRKLLLYRRAVAVWKSATAAVAAEVAVAMAWQHHQQRRQQGSSSSTQRQQFGRPHNSSASRKPSCVPATGRNATVRQLRRTCAHVDGVKSLLPFQRIAQHVTSAQLWVSGQTTNMPMWKQHG